ncbi:hypothetical protein LTR91_020389 [Friedmanniomyces endolithicus]|uniref:Transcription elongation factor Eaf N-terminal domain-containing protein n=1 Tax=Friedmanniomyces endolithicus TaxID=329885 RepID=A0AAN6H907_9PEZI|nr:hypothetical protein LTR94_016467 [Friedmanniomyces endolithicus]KAK0789738.1 hypothetical protein LTR75_012270 [Friedmanniomyces endolithicus]KAK0799896.1 hypothetical protein LTR59_005957 [Friedmanniomyces endolithicus]KAK0820255.1 hypothetical protein LTR38_000163 [Friedmanniomyces endolithicus]KAK0850986.1 hypothetical protein LTR03_004275 [Friedmanniomyces endolithicus]
MATASLLAPMIDLRTPATYNIRLGDSILKAGDFARSWASVRYNHKPALVDREQAACSIRSTGKKDASELSLKDGGKQYGYSGDSTKTEHRYVLLLRDEGEGKEAVLEQLDWSHAFNLTSTSDEKDAGKLRELYPYLAPEHDVDNSRLSDENSAAEAPPDPANPFDYRHFLKAAASAAPAKTRRPDTGAPRSGTAIPTLSSRPPSSTSLARPLKRAAGSPLVQGQKKRRAPASTDRAADPNRVQTNKDRPSTPNLSHLPTSSAPPPRIRVDRKASLRKPSHDDNNDDDDSGELILENEDPISGKLPSGRRAMAMALNGQLGRGPISLRSAAGSPLGSGYLASPTGLGQGVEGEDAETGERGGYEGNEEASDADADADVEDLELPSPAAAHRPSVSAATITSGNGGEDDDLDAQLAAAMAEEEGVPAGAGEVVEVEEEESEEE